MSIFFSHLVAINWKNKMNSRFNPVKNVVKASKGHWKYFWNIETITDLMQMLNFYDPWKRRFQGVSRRFQRVLKLVWNEIIVFLVKHCKVVSKKPGPKIFSYIWSWEKVILEIAILYSVVSTRSNPQIQICVEIS